MKVYLSEHIHPEALHKLQARAEIVDSLDNPAGLDAAIVRVAAFPRQVMEQAPRLKVIAKHGIGYDNIDVEAARSLGIRVVYTPIANVNSVAELIVGLILACNRRIVMADAGVRRSAYVKTAPGELIGHELENACIGLVGLGKIAQRAAAILRNGFGCRLLGYDPYVSREKAAEIHIEKYDNLGDMVAAADCVTVSVPLTESTRNLIDADMLARMKPGAVLVNAARGGIVNEQALYAALKKGTLFAAACDVFETEPPTAAHPLATLANFIATPHIGANTEEALYRMGMTAVDDVFSILDGREPKYPV